MVPTTPVPGASTLAAGIALLAIITLRHRLTRERPLRLWRQWVALGLCASFTLALFAAVRPSAHVLWWSALAMIAGTALGVVRARMIVVGYDENGQLVQHVPAGAFWLLVAIVACVRPVLRLFISHEIGAGIPHSDLALLAFALGMITGARAELTLRSRSLRAR